MSIAQGNRLGPYEILAPLGAGGMGEVWRARDTRLGRDVAIKVLPDLFARDAGRLARFQREAQLLASLNHPNIAALYGLEESNGLRALVMELVEGQTLAERIAAGPVPPDELFPIVRQIIDALEEAHERGIVHRDLKPANIKVTAEGKVKVLDFGLAKALTAEPAEAVAANSPTLTAAALTGGAVLLGTAAYMSPEQARGRNVDKRSDIFSFGAVLYEMLAGRQAFGGETVSDSLAAILTREPDRGLLPSSTPPNLGELLDRCLEKNPKLRLRDIGEARILLARPPAEPAAPPPAEAPTTPPRRAWIPWAVAGLAALLAAFAVGLLLRAPQPAPRPVVHLSTPLPDLNEAAGIALSSDGSRLAYAAGSPPRLHVRLLDQLEGKPIAGTESALDPFFSPDGQWLGFFQENKWKKVQVLGGPVITLCDGSTSPFGAGASWGPDGTILVGSLDQGLSRISAAGGAPLPATTLDPQTRDRAHRWPHFLPGGEVVLFTASQGSFDDGRILLLSLRTGRQRVLIEGGTAPRYVHTGPASPGGSGTGHIIYLRSGSLFAVPFHLERLEVAGSPVPVLEGVRSDPLAGSGLYDISRAGSLVYVPGGQRLSGRNLAWLDRQGKAQPIPAPPRPYSEARLSPDGRRVAVVITDAGRGYGLWVYDLARGTMTRLAFQPFSTSPVWTPDGRRVTFGAGSVIDTAILWTLADGSGQPEKLLDSGRPSSWSPDGKTLALEMGSPARRDIFLWTKPDGPAPSGHAAKPFLQTEHNETAPIFSPDGRWIAYHSAESGQSEIYVRPAASGDGGKWLISTGGGAAPRWAGSGRELFYLVPTRGNLMAVPIEPGPVFRPGNPRELFTSNAILTGSGSYDVSADGQRFLMILAGDPGRGAAAPEIRFVLEWFEDLRRRVRAGERP